MVCADRAVRHLRIAYTVRDIVQSHTGRAESRLIARRSALSFPVAIQVAGLLLGICGTLRCRNERETIPREVGHGKYSLGRARYLLVGDRAVNQALHAERGKVIQRIR
jgi:hypothetical protein